MRGGLYVIALGVSCGLVLLPLGPVASADSKRCPRGTRTVEVKVERGDRLVALVKAHKTTIADVVTRNPGLNPDALREGQELRLCAGSARRRALRGCGQGRKIYEHKVTAGESLGAIAKRYGVTDKELFKRNGSLGGRPERLRAGQRLSVCTLPTRANAAKACNYQTPLHDHIVVPGEWLSEIASRYGVPKKDILRLNPRLRRNPDYLRPGRKLKVCPDIAPRTRQRIIHHVVRGQSLASIAGSYDLNPRQLLKFQQGRLTNPDKLSIGQRLVVWKDGGIVPGFVDDDGRESGGQLVDGLQLPSSPYYRIKNRNTAWGSAVAVRLVQAATANYGRGRRVPTVLVGDLSRKGGGPFPPHKSHRTGMDVDVGYALRGTGHSVKRFTRATKGNLDVPSTWRLVDAFLDTDQVRYIFMDYRIQGLLYEYAKERGVSRARLEELFQYPRGRRRAYGIIRDDPGHDDHFHVRFR